MGKKIILSSKLYDEKAIKQAINDYSEYCDAKILDCKFTVEITPKKEYEDEPVVEEFCNYVLGLMKNM